MSHGYGQRPVTDEDRRELLKALGVAGAAASVGVTLEELGGGTSVAATEELAPVGKEIYNDLAGKIDAGLISANQAQLASATQALAAVEEKGLPSDSPRNDFNAVAEAGRPIYEHLTGVGFFESTTAHLPEFNPEFLQTAVASYVQSEALTEPLSDLGFAGQAGVDLIAPVVSNAKEIQDQHWIASDKIARDEITFGGAIPDVTRGAAGGVLLWLEDLDLHLYQKEILISDQILEDAIWHGQSMAAGFHLMSEGAKAIGEDSNEYSHAELGALMTVGFAVQTISQVRLPENVYWITEELRAERSV